MKATPGTKLFIYEECLLLQQKVQSLLLLSVFMRKIKVYVDYLSLPYLLVLVAALKRESLMLNRLKGLTSKAYFWLF